GGNPVNVATFTDTYPTPQASDYTGTINWGDGHTSAASFAPNGSGGFYVSGGNTYGTFGWYPVAISIQNIRGAAATLTSSMLVDDAPLGATGTSFTVAQGAPFGNVIARFTHADPNALLGYSASIDWGDGTSSDQNLDSIGAVSAEGRNNFVVTGFHTYGTAGTYPVAVTVSDSGGSQATTT